jgi:hypothetical protein
MREQSKCVDGVFGLDGFYSVALYNALREKTILSGDEFAAADHSEVWILTGRNFLSLPVLFK